jgi:SET domain-containing protein
LRASAETALIKYYDDEKQWGIMTDREFQQGELVCEYKGEEITTKQGLKMERELEAQGDYTSCFFFYREGRCIDARNVDSFGKFINHSLSGNLKPEPVFDVHGKFRIFLRASELIPRYSELLYDYGDHKSPLPFMQYNRPPVVYKREFALRFISS